jgi:hypothetical protein
VPGRVDVAAAEAEVTAAGCDVIALCTLLDGIALTDEQRVGIEHGVQRAIFASDDRHLPRPPARPL